MMVSLGKRVMNFMDKVIGLTIGISSMKLFLRRGELSHPKNQVNESRVVTPDF